MDRRRKPKTMRAEAKRPPVRKRPTDDSAKVRDLEKRLVDAHDQQKATADILRIISGAPTELQPVLDAIARNAALVCDAYDAVVFLLESDRVRYAAHYGPINITLQHTTLSRDSVVETAILDRQPVHVHDLLATEPPAFPLTAKAAREGGFRTVLSVPLLRENEAIGALAIRRREAQPFTAQQIALLQTFADQAVIAIENARLLSELHQKNEALTQTHAQVSEALEQQTATSEILRVISRSPTDVQPVFDSLVASAARLCGANDVLLLIKEDEVLRPAAGVGAFWGSLVADFRVPLLRGSVAARSVIAGTTLHIPDLAVASEADFSLGRDLQRRFGHRTVLAVPLVREGAALGTIFAMRFEVRPFADQQISLLKTFADQAVIAIENVRLFTELQARNRDLTEALDQQTATSDILRVISRSPTDVQPVFDTIVESAMRLCDAVQSNVQLFDGELMHWCAQKGISPEAMEPIQRIYPMRPDGSHTAGRAVLSRSIVHLPDVLGDPEYPRELALKGGWRSVLSVPMMREGRSIGAITVARLKPWAFSDTQMALLQTFADQAVIAIENVRLFTELEARNRELTAALDQQTATSEILRVISSSPTDIQPVFDAIVRSAVQLCDGRYGTAVRFDGELMHLAAGYNYTPEVHRALHQEFPMAPDHRMMAGRAILSRAVVQVEDALDDREYAQHVAQAGGFRAMLAVPMLREGNPIGAIVVNRGVPGPFSPAQIALLQTFADQAVIAIENVRLFKELEARTRELTSSVDRLTALGDVGRAVSSSLDLGQVLTTIVSRAVQLSGTDAGAIYEYDEGAEVFHLRATEGLPDEFLEAAPILRRGEGVTGEVALTRAPVQIPDISAPGAYKSRAREVLLRLGLRAAFAVPLLHESRVVGGLAVNRQTPGEFPPDIVELLQTFATQSALAIQNARLFHEIADKSRQLETASQHKSEFLANMSHELRTPLNAVIGFSEVLLQRMFGDLNDKQDEYLKDIYASGQHLLSLINDILDLSKIEAGRMELTPAPFPLPSALDNAVTLVKERAARHGIALQVDVDPQVGDLVGDERKVKQVLLNLLSNAVKFTPEGGRISLKASRKDGMVEIAVTDTGIGIAPEDQAAIFEEFRQVGSDETRKQEGTGLGLTLAKKFVELHGGRIWVESAVGRGSTFTFTLPMVPETSST